MENKLVITDRGYLHHSIPERVICLDYDLTPTRTYTKEEQEMFAKSWDTLKKITDKYKPTLILNGKVYPYEDNK